MGQAGLAHEVKGLMPEEFRAVAQGFAALDKAIMLRTGQATERSEISVSKVPDVILPDHEWDLLAEAIKREQDRAAPSEFSVRGRAHLVEEDAVRSAVAAAWYFGVDETYHLFEFSIEAALLEARAPGEWPTFHHWTPAG